MTLREAEKAVLLAALAWSTEPPGEGKLRAEGALMTAAHRYRHVRASGKPKAKCYCGKTVSIEGDSLRWHNRGDRIGEGHCPYLKNVRELGGKLL